MLKKSSTAQVGGPNAGSRLTAKTTPSAMAYWAATDTVAPRQGLGTTSTGHGVSWISRLETEPSNTRIRGP